MFTLRPYDVRNSNEEGALPYHPLSPTWEVRNFKAQLLKNKPMELTNNPIEGHRSVHDLNSLILPWKYRPREPLKPSLHRLGL